MNKTIKVALSMLLIFCVFFANMCTVFAVDGSQSTTDGEHGGGGMPFPDADGGLTEYDGSLVTYDYAKKNPKLFKHISTNNTIKNLKYDVDMSPPMIDGLNQWIEKGQTKNTANFVYEFIRVLWEKDFEPTNELNTQYVYWLVEYFSFNFCKQTLVFSDYPAKIIDGHLLVEQSNFYAFQNYNSESWSTSLVLSNYEASDGKKYYDFGLQNVSMFDPKIHAQSVVYPINGKIMPILDGGGNDITPPEHGPIDGDLFSRPYYKLSEWNAIMDKKGGDFLQYKIKPNTDIPPLRDMNAETGYTFDKPVTSAIFVQYLAKFPSGKNRTLIYSVNEKMVATQHLLYSGKPVRFRATKSSDPVTLDPWQAEVIYDKDSAIFVMGQLGAYFGKVGINLDVNMINKITTGIILDKPEDTYKIPAKTFIIDDGSIFKPDLIVPGGDNDFDNNIIDDGNGNIVDIGGGTITDDFIKPPKPGPNDGFFAWFDWFFLSVGNFFKSFSVMMKKLISECENFFKFIGSSFSFLPPEIIGILALGISIVILLRIFGR